MKLSRKVGAAIATAALALGTVAMAPSGPAVADTSWGRVISMTVLH